MSEKIAKLAAGLIVFRNISNNIEYLLMQTSYGENHWTPPKGHLDEGENDLTAAIRETQEEAGLYENKDYEFLSKTFTIESKYSIKGTQPKKVLYWLAKVNDPNVKIKLSDEHQDFKWLKLNEAHEIVKYDEMKRILNLAEEFILKNDKHDK